MIGAFYDDFLSTVAKGRGMSKDAVRAVAKGRVWSGSQAMEVNRGGRQSEAVAIVYVLVGLLCCQKQLSSRRQGEWCWLDSSCWGTICSKSMVASCNSCCCYP